MARIGEGVDIENFSPNISFVVCYIGYEIIQIKRSQNHCQVLNRHTTLSSSPRAIKRLKRVTVESTKLCTAIAHVADRTRMKRGGKRAASCLCGEEWLAADHNLISQVTLKCLLACLCFGGPIPCCPRETSSSAAIKMHSRGEYRCGREQHTGQPNGQMNHLLIEEDNKDD